MKSKMKTKISMALCLVLLPMLFISCNKNDHTIIKYYGTGEVRKVKKRINKHESEVHFYLKNGQIEQEGIIYDDSLKDGNWKTYYNDGVLMADLIYSKGKFVKDNVKYPITLDFKDDPSEFKTCNTYQFRVLGTALYTIDIPKKLGDRQIPRSDNGYLYEYEITPKIAGDYTIMVNVKNDSIFFPIKVVD